MYAKIWLNNIPSELIWQFPDNTNSSYFNAVLSGSAVSAIAKLKRLDIFYTMLYPLILVI